MKLTHGSLFSGIGGFDEGASHAEFENVYNCEIDPFCRKELKKRHPNAHQYSDIAFIGNVPKTTVITAGFPCQDVSTAGGGNQPGIFGDRSGLFFEAIRIVDKSRPDYFVMENSPALLGRGMHYVLAALAKIGYMCEWQCLRASDFGYPHRRERIYIVAYPISVRQQVLVFQPIESVSLHAQWTPTPAYLRVQSAGAKPERHSAIVCECDGVPNFCKYIKAIGNAVMPVVAEYVFRCVKQHLVESR